MATNCLTGGHYGAQGLEGQIEIDLVLPRGYHYTEGAPSRWKVSSNSEGLTLEPPRGILRESGGPAAVLTFARSPREEPQRARLVASVYFCEDGGPCLLEEVVFALTFAPGGGQAGLPKQGTKTSIVHRVSPRAAPATALTF